MFGAETAIECIGDIVDGDLYLVAAGKETVAVAGLGLDQIEVDVAVADMAERRNADAGDCLLYTSDAADE